MQLLNYKMGSAIDPLTIFPVNHSNEGLSDYKKNYNISPNSEVSILVFDTHGNKKMVQAKWGGKLGYETRNRNFLGLPKYKHLIRKNRCVVPISYFIFQKLTRTFILHERDRKNLYVAGLYQIIDGKYQFTLLVEPSPKFIKRFVETSPILLRSVKSWLSKDSSLTSALAALDPHYLGYDYYPVNSIIWNSTENNRNLIRKLPNSQTYLELKPENNLADLKARTNKRKRG